MSVAALVIEEITPTRERLSLKDFQSCMHEKYDVNGKFTVEPIEHDSFFYVFDPETPRFKIGFDKDKMVLVDGVKWGRPFAIYPYEFEYSKFDCESALDFLLELATL